MMTLAELANRFRALQNQPPCSQITSLVVRGGAAGYRPDHQWVCETLCGGEVASLLQEARNAGAFNGEDLETFRGFIRSEVASWNWIVDVILELEQRSGIKLTGEVGQPCAIIADALDKVAAMRTEGIGGGTRKSKIEMRRNILALYGRYTRDYPGETRGQLVVRIMENMGVSRSTVYDYLKSDVRNPEPKNMQDLAHLELTQKRKRDRKSK